MCWGSISIGAVLTARFLDVYACCVTTMIYMLCRIYMYCISLKFLETLCDVEGEVDEDPVPLALDLVVSEKHVRLGNKESRIG